MKNNFALFALALAPLAAVAAPPFHRAIAAAPPATLQESADAHPATEMLNQLLTKTKSIDMGINATVTMLHALSAPEGKAAAQDEIVAMVESVISAFNDALDGVRSTVNDMPDDRAEAIKIADQVIAITHEISGTLNHVLNAVPVDTLRDLIAPILQEAPELLGSIFADKPDLEEDGGAVLAMVYGALKGIYDHPNLPSSGDAGW